MEPLGIHGAWVFAPHVHRDDRGSFTELFRGAEFCADLGYQLDVAQANCSVSRRSVLRGIHFADVPPGQAKYVTCVNGSILDVAVDLRVGSPTFGRWEAVRLGEDYPSGLFISEGLGHAFMALSEQATVVYLCSAPYTPGREHAVQPLDPAIGIAWPPDSTVVMSERDAAAPTLEESRIMGALPNYDQCAAYIARSRGARRH